jgi:demethylmenaquinone methyltransferase/2-methoxy-6-polyprenyl-1,4-benzoquinol methylase
MEEKKGRDLVYHFFSGTGMTYDHMVKLCTLGFDLWWKRKIMEKIPEGAARIMDQACGTGILTFKMARKVSLGQVIGVDLQEEYLDIAKRRAKELKLNNIQFILGRAEDVSLKKSFDCIASSYLAKYVEIEHLIRNIRKMLRKGGILIMHDFTYPSIRPFAKAWDFYFKILQTVGTWRYPQWGAIFNGLPELLRETKWVTELVGSLGKNGFSDITLQSLTLGTSVIVTARKM